MSSHALQRQTQMWVSKVSSTEKAERTAWQSVKRYAIAYYTIVFLLPFIGYLVIGKPNIKGWTFDSDDWAGHAPDFWWQLALVLPTLVWLICKAAVVKSYQQGIEDATRGAFGYSYFDTEHWLIGKHVDLREKTCERQRLGLRGLTAKTEGGG